jgi:hypothetical protein
MALQPFGVLTIIRQFQALDGRVVSALVDQCS